MMNLSKHRAEWVSDHLLISFSAPLILCFMTVPSDRNISLKETEKKWKYKDLELEIQRMWHMKTVVITVVVGALGTVKKGMVANIKKVSERAASSFHTTSSI